MDTMAKQVLLICCSSMLVTILIAVGIAWREHLQRMKNPPTFGDFDEDADDEPLA